MLNFKHIGACLGIQCIVVVIVVNITTKTEHSFSDLIEKSDSTTTDCWNRTYTSSAHEDSEERRLKESPFIYQDAMDRIRLLPRPSQRTVKLISTYLQWDKNLLNGSINRFRNCRYNNCRYTYNMSEADAVIFISRSFRDHVIRNFYRPKGQRWIFYTVDPAINSNRMNRLDAKSAFNWTMTYQLRSDIPVLFGLLKKRVSEWRDFENVYDKKDRESAWFVSHCDTSGLREKYVERMGRIIQVDIFGRCSNMTCGPFHLRSTDKTECLPMLTQHYKFYLAFENSFCKDYITEKFFKLFDDVDIIPVVRGGFNYKKYLPSGIFVDSSDFKTPEDLARHLVWLGQNKTEYVAMLKRKSQWIMAYPESFHCRMCQKLHTSSPTSHYSDLKTAFRGDPPDCWAPTDLEL